MTERHRAEQATRSSRQQLADIQRVARIGSFEWELATGRLSASDELFRMAGLEPGSVSDLGGGLAFVHPDDLGAVQDTLVRLARDPAPYEMELRITRPDGSVRTLLSRAEGVRDRSGEVVRVVGTQQDITERHQAEQELRESRRQLAEAQRVARTGSFELDVASDRFSPSPGLFRLFGLDPGAPLDHQVALARIHPDDLPALRESIGRVIGGGAGYEVELRARHADGSWRTLLARGRACATGPAGSRGSSAPSRTSPRPGRPSRSAGACSSACTRRWRASTSGSPPTCTTATCRTWPRSG